MDVQCLQIVIKIFKTVFFPQVMAQKINESNQNIGRKAREKDKLALSMRSWVLILYLAARIIIIKERTKRGLCYMGEALWSAVFWSWL